MAIGEPIEIFCHSVPVSYDKSSEKHNSNSNHIKQLEYPIQKTKNEYKDSLFDKNIITDIIPKKKKYICAIAQGNNHNVVIKTLNATRPWWNCSSNHNSSLFNLMWRQTLQGMKWDHVNERQMVNRTKGASELCTKGRLLRCMAQHCDAEKANVFQYLPLTFRFCSDLTSPTSDHGASLRLFLRYFSYLKRNHSTLKSSKTENSQETVENTSNNTLTNPFVLPQFLIDLHGHYFGSSNSELISSENLSNKDNNNGKSSNKLTTTKSNEQGKEKEKNLKLYSNTRTSKSFVPPGLERLLESLPLQEPTFSATKFVEDCGQRVQAIFEPSDGFLPPKEASNDPIWMLKPASLSRGRGIDVFSSLSQLSQLLNIPLNVLSTLMRADDNVKCQELISPLFVQPKKSSHAVESRLSRQQQHDRRFSNDKTSSPSKKRDSSVAGIAASSLRAEQEGRNPVPTSSEVQKSLGVSDWVVQKYMECPMLYHGRKFDIRMWAVLTPDRKVYLFRNGYVRTASKTLNLNSLDRDVHLTNNAVQKHSEEYGSQEAGNQLSFAELGEYMEATMHEDVLAKCGMRCSCGKEGGWCDDSSCESPFIKRVKELCVMAFEAAAPSLLSKENLRLAPKTFEIFGVDLMIDENGGTWLIELNANPCFEESSPLLTRIIPHFIDNLFTVAVDPYFKPPNPPPPISGVEASAGVMSPALSAEDNLNHADGYRYSNIQCSSLDEKQQLETIEDGKNDNENYKVCENENISTDNQAHTDNILESDHDMMNNVKSNSDFDSEGEEEEVYEEPEFGFFNTRGSSNQDDSYIIPSTHPQHLLLVVQLDASKIEEKVKQISIARSIPYSVSPPPSMKQVCLQKDLNLSPAPFNNREGKNQQQYLHSIPRMTFIPSLASASGSPKATLNIAMKKQRTLENCNSQQNLVDIYGNARPAATSYAVIHGGRKSKSLETAASISGVERGETDLDKNPKHKNNNNNNISFPNDGGNENSTEEDYELTSSSLLNMEKHATSTTSLYTMKVKSRAQVKGGYSSLDTHSSSRAVQSSSRPRLSINRQKSTKSNSNSVSNNLKFISEKSTAEDEFVVSSCDTHFPTSADVKKRKSSNSNPINSRVKPSSLSVKEVPSPSSTTYLKIYLPNKTSFFDDGNARIAPKKEPILQVQYAPSTPPRRLQRTANDSACSPISLLPSGKISFGRKPTEKKELSESIVNVAPNRNGMKRVSSKKKSKEEQIQRVKKEQSEAISYYNIETQPETSSSNSSSFVPCGNLFAPSLTTPLPMVCLSNMNYTAMLPKRDEPSLDSSIVESFIDGDESTTTTNNNSLLLQEETSVCHHASPSIIRSRWISALGGRRRRMSFDAAMSSFNVSDSKDEVVSNSTLMISSSSNSFSDAAASYETPPSFYIDKEKTSAESQSQSLCPSTNAEHALGHSFEGERNQDHISTATPLDSSQLSVKKTAKTEKKAKKKRSNSVASLIPPVQSNGTYTAILNSKKKKSDNITSTTNILHEITPKKLNSKNSTIASADHSFIPATTRLEKEKKKKLKQKLPKLTKLKLVSSEKNIDSISISSTADNNTDLQLHQQQSQEDDHSSNSQELFSSPVPLLPYMMTSNEFTSNGDCLVESMTTKLSYSGRLSQSNEHGEAREIGSSFQVYSSFAAKSNNTINHNTITSSLSQNIQGVPIHQSKFCTNNQSSLWDKKLPPINNLLSSSQTSSNNKIILNKSTRFPASDESLTLSGRQMKFF